jgi:hypothetical protein
LDKLIFAAKWHSFCNLGWRCSAHVREHEKSWKSDSPLAHRMFDQAFFLLFEKQKDGMLKIIAFYALKCVLYIL